MQRSSSTVVCVVGDVPDALAPVLGSHTTYVVHDEDPLAAVADAWTRLFEETGPIGELEVAVTDTVARWRARSIELPDYYLVTGVDALTPTARHWYFGVLHAAAPTRVVPVDAAVDRVLATLEALAPGPWWPPVDRLLAGIERRAPELLVPPDGTTTEGTGALLLP